MGEGREVRCGETDPRQGSLARRGTLGRGHRAAGRKKHSSPQTVDLVLPVLPGL